jgi:hypothetical protein
MTPSFVTASPDWVRVDAADPAPWRSAGHASVVHLGHSALVLARARGQLVITSDAFGLVPGGIQVTRGDLARLHRELGAGGGGLAGWRPAVVEPADLRLHPVRVHQEALEVLARAAAAPRPAGPFDPSRQRADAVSLAGIALTGGPPTRHLLRLIGAGPGSTPAGDDVVAGVLAGLHATGRAAAASALGARVRPLLHRTTSASAHYLAAAADGRFAERVHVLVAGLHDARAAARAARAALGFGATSGADLLAGLVAVAGIPLDTRKSA